MTHEPCKGPCLEHGSRLGRRLDDGLENAADDRLEGLALHGGANADTFDDAQELAFQRLKGVWIEEDAVVVLARELEPGLDGSEFLVAGIEGGGEVIEVLEV